MIWKMTLFRQNMIGRVYMMAGRNLSTSSFLRKTYYDALGVQKTATQAEIKKAYFELSKLYHPDKIEPTDENLAKFREISTAYEILSNEQSKKLYDRGLLGDMSKPFTDNKEVVDPIVNFYKQRQELSKQLLKTDKEIRTWSPPLKKYRESNVSQKYNYYKKPGELEYAMHIPIRVLYLVCVVTATVFIFQTNLSGTPARYYFLKLKEFFNW